MLARSFLAAQAKSRTIISSHYLIVRFRFLPSLFPHKENKSPSTHHPPPTQAWKSCPNENGLSTFLLHQHKPKQ